MSLPVSPRALLVEDDASVARFVGLAIEDLPIDLTVCADVASALVALKEAPCFLIITDLMLPGESGLDLVKRLQADKALLGEALIVVYSAGLNTQSRAELAAYPIWRMLSKPVSVGDLTACVQDALSAVLAIPSGPVAPVSVAAPIAQAHSLRPEKEADAITAHFGGDAELFDEYREACLGQFLHDIATGDLAVATSDWAALTRLAHSLKTVLMTLGDPEGSAVAAELERSAAASAVLATKGWHQLRRHLR